MTKIFKLFLLVLSFIFVQRFCHKQTDGFAVLKISSFHSFRPEWEVIAHPPIDEIKAILSQPFHYLAKGAQSYVFASADGKYVLKFFRHSHMRPPFWAPKSEIGKKRSAKLEKDFKSYLIAYQEMKEEAGLLFLHLNKTDKLKMEIPIYDKIGIKHLLDADKMDFMLQRRASLVYPALENWIAEGNIDSAKKGIDNLIELIITRSKKGISDKDPDLNTNFGFIGEKAVQIDIGRFKKLNSSKNSEELRDEIVRITDSFKYWLNDRSPELSDHLQKSIDSHYHREKSAAAV